MCWVAQIGNDPQSTRRRLQPASDMGTRPPRCRRTPADAQQAIDAGDLEPIGAVTLAKHADDDELLTAVLDERGHRDLDRFIDQHLHRRE